MSTTTTQIPSAEAAAPSRSSHASKRGFAAYCAILVLLPALFLSSSIPIVRSPSFPKIAADPFLLFPDYAFSLVHEDCEILIFGDSTAVTGLDPTAVQTSTGLKTCNIAQSQSVVAIMGTRALDEYLKHNKPPRFLVLQFAPETFAHSSKDFFWPEGLTVLVRRDLGPRALFLLATNPQQAYAFAMWAIKAKFASLRSVPDLEMTETVFEQRRGLLVIPKPPETACYQNRVLHPSEPAWIRSLRAKYSSSATQVIVNVSPVPSCAKNIATISSSLNGITDNQLPVYPIHLFSDLDRHLTLEGAERASAALARQILASESNLQLAGTKSSHIAQQRQNAF
ncbi:MAG TPA: hypothetical protein VGM27_20235 [Acidobacteriaceae bacterium]